MAEHLSGSVEEFVALMNKRAKKIGCTNTHFANASGVKIGKIQSYSTAKDIVLIAKEAFKNKKILKIAKTAKHTLKATNKSDFQRRHQSKEIQRRDSGKDRDHTGVQNNDGCGMRH